MNRIQWLALCTVSAILIILLLAHLSLSRSNTKAAAQLTAARTYVNNARQLQPALENLVRRINSAGQNDFQLKALLTKYDIKVNIPAEKPDSKPAVTPKSTPPTK